MAFVMITSLGGHESFVSPGPLELTCVFGVSVSHNRQCRPYSSSSESLLGVLLLRLM